MGCYTPNSGHGAVLRVLWDYYEHTAEVFPTDSEIDLHGGGGQDILGLMAWLEREGRLPRKPVCRARARAS